MKYLQKGGGKCSLCETKGSTMASCPWNPKAIVSGKFKLNKHKNVIGKKPTKKAIKLLEKSINEYKETGNKENVEKLQYVLENGVMEPEKPRKNPVTKNKKTVQKEKSPDDIGGGGVKDMQDNVELQNAYKESNDYVTVNLNDIGAQLQKIQININDTMKSFKLGLPYPENTEIQYHNLYDNSANSDLILRGRCIMNKDKTLNVQLVIN